MRVKTYLNGRSWPRKERKWKHKGAWESVFLKINKKITCSLVPKRGSPLTGRIRREKKKKSTLGVGGTEKRSIIKKKKDREVAKNTMKPSSVWTTLHPIGGGSKNNNDNRGGGERLLCREVRDY